MFRSSRQKRFFNFPAFFISFFFPDFSMFPDFSIIPTPPPGDGAFGTMAGALGRPGALSENRSELAGGLEDLGPILVVLVITLTPLMAL